MRQDQDAPSEAAGKRLPAPAQRALAEAQERRRQELERVAAAPRVKEIGGQPGPEPTRYGDWERNGIATDF
jgi:hypothetical protein